MDVHLEAQLAHIFEARNRNDMEPTIRALVPIAAEHPHDPHVLYELGGAYDTAGQEEAALDYYERAMAEGLSGDSLRRCSLQYGSTLRNVGRFDESLTVFADAREQFPESVALAVFEALTLHASGRFNAAVGSLLKVIADQVQSVDIDRYKAAIRGNAAHITGLREEDSQHNLSEWGR